MMWLIGAYDTGILRLWKATVELRDPKLKASPNAFRITLSNRNFLYVGFRFASAIIWVIKLRSSEVSWRSS